MRPRAAAAPPLPRHLITGMDSDRGDPPGPDGGIPKPPRRPRAAAAPPSPLPIKIGAVREREEGMQILRRLALGDVAALSPWHGSLQGIDTQEREWGLAYDPREDEYVIVRGELEQVQWGRLELEDYRSLAHSHPLEPPARDFPGKRLVDLQAMSDAKVDEFNRLSEQEGNDLRLDRAELTVPARSIEALLDYAASLFRRPRRLTIDWVPTMTRLLPSDEDVESNHLVGYGQVLCLPYRVDRAGWFSANPQDPAIEVRYQPSQPTGHADRPGVQIFRADLHVVALPTLLWSGRIYTIKYGDGDYSTYLDRKR